MDAATIETRLRRHPKCVKDKYQLCRSKPMDAAHTRLPVLLGYFNHGIPYKLIDEQMLAYLFPN